MNLRAVALGGALVAAGCGPARLSVEVPAPAQADAGAPAPDAGLRTARRIVEGVPAEVVVVPFDTRGTVQGQALLTGAPASSIALEAQGGAIDFVVGEETGVERLTVERAQVALADVVLSPDQLPPSGLHLTHLSARLKAPAQGPVRWFGEVEGLADLRGDLVLSGDILADDGSTSPFDPQEVDGVTLQADLTTDAFGDLVVRFSVDRDGPLWTWQGLYQTRDLHLSGRALDASAAAQVQ